jgi:hypothetical protein
MSCDDMSEAQEWAQRRQFVPPERLDLYDLTRPTFFDFSERPAAHVLDDGEHFHFERVALDEVPDHALVVSTRQRISASYGSDALP